MSETALIVSPEGAAAKKALEKSADLAVRRQARVAASSSRGCCRRKTQHRQRAEDRFAHLSPCATALQQNDRHGLLIAPRKINPLQSFKLAAQSGLVIAKPLPRLLYQTRKQHQHSAFRGSGPSHRCYGPARCHGLPASQPPRPFPQSRSKAI